MELQDDEDGYSGSAAMLQMKLDYVGDSQAVASGYGRDSSNSALEADTVAVPVPMLPRRAKATGSHNSIRDSVSNPTSVLSPIVISHHMEHDMSQTQADTLEVVPDSQVESQSRSADDKSKHYGDSLKDSKDIIPLVLETQENDSESGISDLEIKDSERSPERENDDNGTREEITPAHNSEVANNFIDEDVWHTPNFQSPTFGRLDENGKLAKKQNFTPPLPGLSSAWSAKTPAYGATSLPSSPTSLTNRNLGKPQTRSAPTSATKKRKYTTLSSSQRARDLPDSYEMISNGDEDADFGPLIVNKAKQRQDRALQRLRDGMPQVRQLNSQSPLLYKGSSERQYSAEESSPIGLISHRSSASSVADGQPVILDIRRTSMLEDMDGSDRHIHLQDLPLDDRVIPDSQQMDHQPDVSRDANHDRKLAALPDSPSPYNIIDDGGEVQRPRPRTASQTYRAECPTQMITDDSTPQTPARTGELVVVSSETAIDKVIDITDSGKRDAIASNQRTARNPSLIHELPESPVQESAEQTPDSQAQPSINATFALTGLPILPYNKIKKQRRDRSSNVPLSEIFDFPMSQDYEQEQEEELEEPKTSGNPKSNDAPILNKDSDESNEPTTTIKPTKSTESARDEPPKSEKPRNRSSSAADTRTSTRSASSSDISKKSTASRRKISTPISVMKLPSVHAGAASKPSSVLTPNSAVAFAGNMTNKPRVVLAGGGPLTLHGTNTLLSRNSKRKRAGTTTRPGQAGKEKQKNKKRAKSMPALVQTDVDAAHDNRHEPSSPTVIAMEISPPVDRELGISNSDDDEALDASDDEDYQSTQRRSTGNSRSRSTRSRTTSRDVPDDNINPPKDTTYTLGEIVAPNRILGLCPSSRGYRGGYYPGTLLCDMSGDMVQVQFDGFEADKLGAKNVRSLDLRVDDIVRIVNISKVRIEDDTGKVTSDATKFQYRIVGLLRREREQITAEEGSDDSAEDSMKMTCIRGYNVLRVVKHLQTSRHEDEDTRIFTVPVSHVLIPQRSIDLLFKRPVPELIARKIPALAAYSLHVGLGEATRDELDLYRRPPKELRGDGGYGGEAIEGNQSEHGTPRRKAVIRNAEMQGVPSKGIFRQYAFVLSDFPLRETVTLQEAIRRNGGVYLEKGMQELFTLRVMATRENPDVKGFQLTPTRQQNELYFVFAISASNKKTVKAGQAMALGFPCLQKRFLQESEQVGRIVPWTPFATAHAGEADAFCLFAQNWSLNVRETIARRHKILEGKNVIVLLGRSPEAVDARMYMMTFMAAARSACVWDEESVIRLVAGAGAGATVLPRGYYSVLEPCPDDLVAVSSRTSASVNSTDNDDDGKIAATSSGEKFYLPSPEQEWDYVYVVDENHAKFSERTQTVLDARGVKVVSKPWLHRCLDAGKLVDDDTRHEDEVTY
ncbi:uncharacterized protein V1518DRAFT_426712 [Limtongia smithiae]|uniref:uncharacterized protein n=1 Tax=Limtongia smithiae TaxID=1125753 RepID=UPI0034CEA727